MNHARLAVANVLAFLLKFHATGLFSFSLRMTWLQKILGDRELLPRTVSTLYKREDFSSRVN